MTVQAMRAGIWSATLIACASISFSQVAHAAPRAGGKFLMSCANGANYPVYAHGATDLGDMITGSIVFAPRRHARFRLIPMGSGYRYAGHGFWFDGIRNQTLLYAGRSGPIPCTLTLA